MNTITQEERTRLVDLAGGFEPTWRNVIRATWRSKRSIFQPWRQGREWVLALECDHTEYRLMRYSGQANGATHTLEQALPAPRKVRCAQCAMRPDQRAHQ